MNTGDGRGRIKYGGNRTSLRGAKILGSMTRDGDATDFGTYKPLSLPLFECKDDENFWVLVERHDSVVAAR